MLATSVSLSSLNNVSQDIPLLAASDPVQTVPLALSVALASTTIATVASAPSLPALIAAAALTTLSQTETTTPTASATMLVPSAPDSSTATVPPAFVPSMTSSASTMMPFGVVAPPLAPESVVSSADSVVSSVSDARDSSIDPTRSLKHQLHIEDEKYANYRPLVVGHRGALYLDLENTRSGFIKSAEIGCDAVELDVFLLKCGSLIVFHGGGTDENPGDLYDYCNRVGNILNLTYDEALQLQFNPRHAEFPCPEPKILAGTIPTLEQVLLDAKQTGIHVKIELKGEGTVEPTLEVVDRLGMVDQVSFASFDHGRIARLRELRPEVSSVTGKHVYRTAALFKGEMPGGFLEECASVGADEIHMQYDYCTVDIVRSIHDAGFGSMAWFRGPIGMASDTMNKYWDVDNEDIGMYELFMKTGIQQMCVNRPDVLIQAIQRMGSKV